jgi:hypothetical protein
MTNGRILLTTGSPIRDVLGSSVFGVSTDLETQQKVGN